jgi:zinc ribbon protein
MSQLMSQLVCPECRHENEPERVYCHNCGAKLNRAPATTIPGKTDDAETVATRERLRRMMDQRGVKTRQLILNIAKLVLGACLAAVLVQMVLPPDLPATGGKDLELGPQIGLDLENALMQHRGAQLTYEQDQVNNYLANTLKRKKTSLLDKPMLEFRRGVAQFDEGVFHMTVERSIFGLSLYTSAFYRVNVQDGKIAPTHDGGMIGRMPVHPELMRYAGFLFSDVWKALEQDEKQVAKMAGIEFHPKTVVLTAPVQ